MTLTKSKATVCHFKPLAMPLAMPLDATSLACCILLLRKCDPALDLSARKKGQQLNGC